MSTISAHHTIRRGYVYRMDGTDGYYYFGSTQRTLEGRFRAHRNVENLPVIKQQAVTLHFSSLGWDKVRIVSVHESICTRDDLYRAEGEFIKQHLGNPLCLNRRISGLLQTRTERFARVYAERDGIRISCECGDSIVQAALPGHLTSGRHSRNMILMTLPVSVEEKPADQYERCECGEMVRHYNFSYHLLTATHIWKMRVKHLPEQKIIATPPAVPTPEGFNPRVTHCLCPCGLFANREQFRVHLKTEKHLKNMVKNGLIKLPEYIPPVDTTIPAGKQRCACGQLVSISHPREHQETTLHQARMRQLTGVPATTGPLVAITTEEYVSDDGDFPVEDSKSRKKKQVICECGNTVTASSLKLHQASKGHLDRMKRRAEGIPSPVVGLARQKEVVTCECGSKSTRGNLSQHRKNGPHKKWEESQQVT